MALTLIEIQWCPTTKYSFKVCGYAMIKDIPNETDAEKVSKVFYRKRS